MKKQTWFEKLVPESKLRSGWDPGETRDPGTRPDHTGPDQTMVGKEKKESTSELRPGIDFSIPNQRFRTSLAKDSSYSREASA